ncbi:MAG: SpoIIE family protein phosphatase [Leptospira sp.]|nr:SpoIIE family protein phosphatase [Leptospira sp.]
MIFHNFFTILGLVGMLTSLLIGSYMLTLKGKSKPTKYLGLFIILSFVLALGWFVGPLILNPVGAYHRYLTVPGILWSLAFLVHFGYHYPRNYNVKESRIVLIVTVTTANIISALFIYVTRKEIPYFDFGQHTYNFSQAAGRPTGLCILIFVLIFLTVMFRKIRRLEGEERKGAINLTVAVVYASLIPAISNILRNAGKLDPETAQTVNSLVTLTGYFAMLMVFINNTIDKTSFMVKIIGISVVTVLLIVQGIYTVVLKDKELVFDDNKKVIVENVIEKIALGDKENFREEILYVASMPLRDGKADPGNLKFIYKKRNSGFDFEHITQSIGKTDSVSHGRRYQQSNLNELSIVYRSTDPENSRVIEIGFPYTEYRTYIDRTAAKITYLTIGLVFGMLILFPIFFFTSLVKPLNGLLAGVTKVNMGDLTVKVPIKVQDEIGFLSSSFNSMVSSIREARRELQDYAENLEDKVMLRTKEVQEKMEEVHALKVQQDGDYFLTSLLTKPLFYNANKSGNVKTEFIIKQKKNFEFREKKADLGGDLCITGNLKFGSSENFRTFTMAMNGDAMGKSMQGAGGSLVMGVVMNSIMARSAGNKRILDSNPERWLTEIYNEIHGVFKSFNGSMVISCVVSIIDDETGEMWYFNAEHPFSVLYRDGKASFIEDDLKLRKLGLDSEIEFQVYKFQLMPGDAVIIASDGRDDLDLTPNEPIRTINDDETLFLKRVEEGKGVISEIEKRIKEIGVITDDLSLLRIGFKEETAGSGESETEPENEETVFIDLDSDENVETYYQQGKAFLKEGETDKALKALSEGYSKSRSNFKLNKLLGLLSFKGKDYVTAVDVLGRYLEYDSDLTDFWFYLSIAEKKLGHYESSLEAAIKLKNIEPENVQNLVNIADLNRLLGNRGEAQFYLDEAHKLDPENKNLKKLMELLKTG